MNLCSCLQNKEGEILVTNIFFCDNSGEGENVNSIIPHQVGDKKDTLVQ